jgi:hypothetical protein
MDEDYLEDEEFLNNVTPDVLGVLKHGKFFERLDNLFYPIEPAREPIHCDHSFERSTRILRDLGFDATEIEEIVAVLRAKGACCDCEVLYNVAEESRLKGEYWKSKAAEYLVHKNHDAGPPACS